MQLIWKYVSYKITTLLTIILLKDLLGSLFEVVYRVHPRGILELRDMTSGAEVSGVAEDFALSMKEVHDMVKHTLEQNTTKMKQ